MNNQETYRLTDLIRLLDHALAPERDVILRERLADDSKLRRRLKIVQKAMTDGMRLDDLGETEANLFKTEEKLSAYLDGQLTDESASEFEDVVLASPSLLRELISSDRFARSDVQSSPITPNSIHHAMQAVIDANVETAQRKSVNSDASHQVLNGQPLVAKTIAAAVESELPSERSERVRPKKSTNDSVPLASKTLRERKGVRFAATVCLVFVAIIGVVWFGIRYGPGKSNIVDSEAERNDTLEGPHVPSVPPKVNDSVAVDETPLVPNREHPDTANQQMPAPEIAVTNSTENKTPQVPPPETVRTIPLKWKRTTGLVVARIARNAPWKPVMQLPGLQEKTKGGGVEIRSLQESWGEAYVGASRIVMGPKTATRLLITQAKQTRFTINYMKGQLAIDSLLEHSEIIVTMNGQETTLTVVEPDTSIAFDSELAEGDLIVLQGAISLHEDRVDAAQKISLTEIRYTGAKDFRQKPRWIATSPNSQTIVRSTAESFLEESNVLTALLGRNSELSDRQMMIAAEWSFELEPTLAVPRAAMSANEIHREAAIGWLLSTKVSVQDQRAVWNQVAGQIFASPLPVADWYISIRKQTPVTPGLLRDLALGISPNQPLFVRQTSIHMLRSISGQPFQTYDPVRPSPRAIGAVRASVRKMISRTSGNAPQRKSPQRRTDRGS